MRTVAVPGCRAHVPRVSCKTLEREDTRGPNVEPELHTQVGQVRFPKGRWNLVGLDFQLLSLLSFLFFFHAVSCENRLINSNNNKPKKQKKKIHTCEQTKMQSFVFVCVCGLFFCWKCFSLCLPAKIIKNCCFKQFLYKDYSLTR